MDKTQFIERVLDIEETYFNLMVGLFCRNMPDEEADRKSELFWKKVRKARMKVQGNRSDNAAFTGHDAELLFLSSIRTLLTELEEICRK